MESSPIDFNWLLLRVAENGHGRIVVTPRLRQKWESLLHGVRVADYSSRTIENTRKYGWFFDTEARTDRCVYCKELRGDRSPGLPCPCRCNAAS
jgi:hypothetical protein